MAELFQDDPAYAASLLKEVTADEEPGELFIVLRQIAKAFGATTANSADLSAEQWVVALAERIRREEVTAAFFAPYAASASGRSLREILLNVGNNPPDSGDELES